MSTNGNPEKKLGTVKVAPNVLETIVYAAAAGVAGVLRLGNAPQKRLFNREGNDGVKIEIKEGAVSADLYIVVSREANMLQVGKLVQTDVSKAVRYMVGMPVEQINVYIQNVE
ncbi:Asp23/Gls24 family envelope stress response protein [Candidatus Chlorohelix sp.]|uniref:Asp23/Gls24 family envelope stress response protein n=1 Tax=Candidatus Chlorohelix sp. TaxID=3139201 RepID=UPI003028EE68